MDLSKGILISLSMVFPAKAVLNLASIGYIFKKLQVNEHVKKVLISEAVTMICGSVLELSGLFSYLKLVLLFADLSPFFLSGLITD